MKRLAWMGAWLVLGCGGDDEGGRPAPERNTDDASVTSDGDPRVTGGARGDAGTSDVDTTPDGGADAGLPGDEVISRLTEAERERLCRTYVQPLYTDEAILAECTVESVIDTGDEASCQAWTKECVAEYSSTQERDRRDAHTECLADLARCSHTVEELRRCVAEEDAEWARITRAHTCADAATLGPSDEPEITLSAECQKLQDTCYSW